MNTHFRTLLLALCLWAAWSGTADAQSNAQTTADSLRRLILPAADDTLKVWQLMELAKALAESSKYDSALDVANGAKSRLANIKKALSEMQYSTTSAPPQTHVDSYTIAGQEFEQELAKLKTIVETDIPHIEKAMEAAQAP